MSVIRAGGIGPNLKRLVSRDIEKLTLTVTMSSRVTLIAGILDVLGCVRTEDTFL